MKRGGRIFKWILLGILFISIFGSVVMLLWNWLIPELFNGPQINFWQALGLLLLSKILFFGGGGKCHGHHGPPWKNRFYEKLGKMTPEEREEFKRRMRDKWCAPKDNPPTNV